MTSQPVLEPLIAAGLIVRIREDGRITVFPDKAITAALDAHIRTHRAELIAILTDWPTPEPPWFAAWMREDDARRARMMADGRRRRQNLPEFAGQVRGTRTPPVAGAVLAARNKPLGNPRRKKRGLSRYPPPGGQLPAITPEHLRKSAQPPTRMPMTTITARMPATSVSACCHRCSASLGLCLI